MHIDSKIHEQAAAVEQVYFVKTDRQVNPRKVEPFLYLPGTIPILVSAPHAVRHIRQKKIKPSDEFTGALSVILHQLTGCHTLAVTKLYGGDANWDDPCLYKERLRNICQQHNIKLVLDLHGAKREHPFDMDIGTMGGYSLRGKTDLLIKLQHQLNKAGLTSISVDYFSAANQPTVTSFATERLGIPALQLEINRRFRAPRQNGGDFARLVQGLACFITAHRI